MKKTIVFRRATIGDLPAICALSQALFEHERQFTDEFDMGWSHSKAGKSFFARRLRSPSSFILLAEENGKPVGYSLVRLSRFSWRSVNPIADINNLSVHPDYRGQGIGARLVALSKVEAKNMGAKRMSVQALAGNERALKFYRAQGFEDFDVAFLMKLD